MAPAGPARRRGPGGRRGPGPGLGLGVGASGSGGRVEAALPLPVPWEGGCGLPKPLSPLGGGVAFGPGCSSWGRGRRRASGATVGLGRCLGGGSVAASSWGVCTRFAERGEGVTANRRGARVV